MKIQSRDYPDAYYERWKTPISEINYPYILLSGMLQTCRESHFFFEAYGSKKIYVMSVINSYPYRVMDEGIASTCIMKYFNRDYPIKKSRGRPRKRSSTWKLWGTGFIQELDENNELSGLGDPKNKNICQYLIQTCSKWIEIVDCEPVWEVHRNIELKKLIEKFLKTRFSAPIPDNKYIR